MPQSDDRRKSFWDDEEDEDQPVSASTTERFDPAGDWAKKIHETEVLLEEVVKKIQNYLNGIEKRLPTERLSLLERRFKEMDQLTPPTAAQKFRLSQIKQSYVTHRERWERLLKNKT